MADVINLRRARKAKERVKREREAAANRTRFGQSKADKTKSAAERKLADRQIDSHRRDNKD